MKDGSYQKSGLWQHTLAEVSVLSAADRQRICSQKGDASGIGGGYPGDVQRPWSEDCGRILEVLYREIC